ncbi:hypothetical protein SAMN03097699_0216 [Flavobacteriaceae bacterium MAR_2010_188]|nr:hypothetical protein SAMN03097699_0216 [Flavobacteriaceae bacterium MAR_2010_188]
MKNIKYLFVFLFSVLLSTSCNNDDDNSSDSNDSALIGSWEASDEDEGIEFSIMLTFNSNNSGTLVVESTFDGETETESDNFTWSTSGNKLTIQSSSEPPSILTYSISGNKLTITDEDGDPTILTKV